MWCILQYNLHFSTYFDHSIQKQLKTEERFILYTPCYMKNVFSQFLTKNNDNEIDAFSIKLLIFNIYLLCIKQN